MYVAMSVAAEKAMSMAGAMAVLSLKAKYGNWIRLWALGKSSP